MLELRNIDLTRLLTDGDPDYAVMVRALVDELYEWKEKANKKK